MSRYGVVLQVSPCRSPTGPVGRDRLVHVPAGPARATPVVEPQLIVGIPVGGADPASEMERDARHAKAGARRPSRRAAADLVGQRSGAPARRRRARGSSRGWPAPRRSSSARRSPATAGRSRGRCSGGRWRRCRRCFRVDDDDLVGPRQRLERRRDVGGLVQGDDRDGHPRHGGECTGEREAGLRGPERFRPTSALRYRTGHGYRPPLLLRLIGAGARWR